MKKFLAYLFIFTLVVSCSSDSSDDTPNPGPGSSSFDREVMLTNWADNIIIPSYEDFTMSLTNLETAFDDFNTTTDQANLEALRTAWLDAYRTWQYASIFEIGPAEAIGYRLQINTYPTDTQLVADNIISGSYDLSLPSNRDGKGFGALDYLLHGLAGDDAQILSAFDANHKAYTQDVIDNMQQLTNQVVSEWNASFRDSFVSSNGSSASASTDRMVNDFIFYYEKSLRAGKMGIPLGVFSGTQAPSTVEAFYNTEISNQLFLDGLTAAQDFFNGKHLGSSVTGESLASYLATLDNQVLRDDINAQFNSARNSVNGLLPFRTELETNDPAINMLTAYDEVQKAVPLLKVDMLSALSISVDFVDADGD